MTGLSPVAALFDAVAPVYETVGPPLFDHFGALLVEVCGVRRGDRVLDLAAGSGAVSVPALAAVGPAGSLLAVDIAPGMVERLGARLSSTGHRAAQAVLGDAASPQVPPDAFVAALCGFGLFFLRDPVAALRSWRLAARPGGTIAVSTWGREDEAFGALRDALVDAGIQARPHGEDFDDPRVLGNALREAGLDEVSVTTVAVDLTLPDVDALLRWASEHPRRACVARTAGRGGPRSARERAQDAVAGSRPDDLARAPRRRLLLTSNLNKAWLHRMRPGPLTTTRPAPVPSDVADRLRAWVRCRLDLPDDVVVVQVSQVRCRDEQCGPVETVLAVLRPGAPLARTSADAARSRLAGLRAGLAVGR